MMEPINIDAPVNELHSSDPSRTLREDVTEGLTPPPEHIVQLFIKEAQKHLPPEVQFSKSSLATIDGRRRLRTDVTYVPLSSQNADKSQIGALLVDLDQHSLEPEVLSLALYGGFPDNLCAVLLTDAARSAAGSYDLAGRIQVISPQPISRHYPPSSGDLRNMVFDSKSPVQTIPPYRTPTSKIEDLVAVFQFMGEVMQRLGYKAEVRMPDGVPWLEVKIPIESGGSTVISVQANVTGKVNPGNWLLRTYNKELATQPEIVAKTFASQYGAKLIK